MNVTEIRTSLSAIAADLAEEGGRLAGYSNRGITVGSGWESHLTGTAERLAKVSRSIDDVLPGQGFGDVLGNDAVYVAKKGARLEAFHADGTRFGDWTSTFTSTIHDIQSAIEALG